MSVQTKKTALVDKDVWLALCLDLGEQAAEAYRFLDGALGVIDLLVTTTCLQEVWSDLCHVLRHVVVQEGGVVDDRVEALITSIAWDCIAFVREVAIVVSSGARDATLADVLRDQHADYGDALLVATAQGCSASCIVSFKESLHECLPVRCLTPHEATIAFNL